MQKALNLLYPPQCLNCDAHVESLGALCPECWRATPFISGLVCDACGTPLPGSEASDAVVICDDCTANPPPWQQARAPLVYRDNARSIVLALKRGDRFDIVAPASRWMARSAGAIVPDDALVVPVPLHWWRMLRRKFNQAALLSGALARHLDAEHCPDLLCRRRHSNGQDGHDRDARKANVDDAFSVTKRHIGRVAGRDIILVDDVVTSGATARAATEVLNAAGAESVRVVALARVERGS